MLFIAPAGNLTLVLFQPILKYVWDGAAMI